MADAAHHLLELAEDLLSGPEGEALLHRLEHLAVRVEDDDLALIHDLLRQARAAGVSLAEVGAELDRRARRVTRRSDVEGVR